MQGLPHQNGEETSGLLARQDDFGHPMVTISDSSAWLTVIYGPGSFTETFFAVVYMALASG